MYGIWLMGEAWKIQATGWKVGQEEAAYHVYSDIISSIVSILPHIVT
jgi:hypothetical protein